MRFALCFFAALIVGCSSSNFDVANGDGGVDALDDVSSGDGSGCATPPCTCDAPLFRCGSTCVNRETDPDHCGACSFKCPRSSNGTATCTNGKCGETCGAGFHDCSGVCVANDSPNSCGTACAPCTAGANASPTCTDKGCGVRCHAGFADCDSNHADCEADLSTAANCGSCGHACIGPTPICAPKSGGGFDCATGCVLPNTLCGTSCVDLTSSPKNCGKCGNDCGSDPNGTWSCASSACSLECNTGFHDCGGHCVSDTDKTQCGSTCTSCSDPPNAVGFCDASSGKCGFSCNAGFADCDPAAPGCETNIDTDPNHCSACDVICAAPVGSTATCVGGVCGSIGTGCAPGSAMVDGKCAVFGGAFESGGGGGGACGCLTGNPLSSGACTACPSGFNPLTFDTESKCGSAPLTLCEVPPPATLPPGPPTVDWGGAFMDESCGSGSTPTCVTKNPYSGDCKCAPGSTEIASVAVGTLSTDDCPTSGTAAIKRIHVCQGSGTPVTFFGAYVLTPDGKCPSPSPGACSCPGPSHPSTYPLLTPAGDGTFTLVICTP